MAINNRVTLFQFAADPPALYAWRERKLKNLHRFAEGGI